MDKPIYTPPIVPPVAPAKPGAKQTGATPPVAGEFSAALQKETQKVSFSAHAQQRRAARNIDLTPEQMGRLEEAVERADGKGAKHSLVLLDSLAFVVSVTNRKVVTAIYGQNIRENVFTNIDSAVVM